MLHRLGRFASIALLATSATFLACQESPTAPGGTSGVVALDGVTSTADASNPVVFSARGSGHMEGPPPGGSEAGWRTFSFTAQQRQDGTTTGNLQYNVNGGTKQHARVFCMASGGNGLVVIGAEGTLRSPESDPPNALGAFGVPDASRPDNHGVFLVVRDNGEGANAAADEITGAAHSTLGFVGGLCGAGSAHPLVGLVGAFLVPIEAGNIQVSP